MSRADDHLGKGLRTWARRSPDAPAIVCEDQSLTYGELNRASNQLAAGLVSLGLKIGDRVGLLLPKSIDSIIALMGVLKAGGVYVPVDLQSPPSRQLALLIDCDVRGLITTSSLAIRLVDEDASFVASLAFVIARDRLTVACQGVPWEFHHDGELRRSLEGSEAAYILYTSGSTGQPKGVTVSHRGAKSFVRWAQRTFSLGPSVRMANHAQLSFDLSVLDIFATLEGGGQVHLLPPELSLQPVKLRDRLAAALITHWYSVPSALTLLAREGRLGEAPPPSLGHVLFAGEVFPVPHLRRVMTALPRARFSNLYGPTETNVCTWYAVPRSAEGPSAEIPIGVPCDHCEVAVLDDSGQPVGPNHSGELCVRGPSVMLGYWGKPERTSAAFWRSSEEAGRWYRTGDVARQDDAGLLWFMGRRDRQVKHRGYRVELGEVEAALCRIPGVREAAVIPVPDERAGSLLRAVVAVEPGIDLSLLTVKLHCGRLVPPYMVPNTVEFRSKLPRTSTGKVDLKSLR